MPSGYLALLLHAHLPYVRHPEYEDFFEEDWFFEAVAETYIPLLQILRGFYVDRVPAKLTLTLTPTLCAMMRDPLLQARTERYLDRAIALAAAECQRTAADPRLNSIAKFYADRFSQARAFYLEEVNRDLVAAFAELQDDGVIEIIGCAATHGFLPLMENYPQAIRAQIMIGRDYHRECFGRSAVGIWLPECGFVAGVEKVLQEADLRWFVIDAHGLMFGQPRPRFAIYSPCYTPSGPAVFGRDRESSKQVWSAEEGFPGDPAYRDFYKDIGHELSLDDLLPFLPADGLRRNTGIKYHRISGRSGKKDLYNRAWAMGAADSHAAHFMWSRERQIEHLRSIMGIEPIVISPFDAELFGHWWFEGPEFLNWFIRKSAYDQQVYQLITPSEFLESHPTAQMVAPSPSSWGHKGYWEVWLDHSNAWIYPHLHAAARRMSECAREFGVGPSERQSRLLAQMARELLLAQSSDWAFLMKTGTASAYAEKRTRDHILRFNRLHDELHGAVTRPSILESCEERDNLFPNINWRYYA